MLLARLGGAYSLQENARHAFRSFSLISGSMFMLNTGYSHARTRKLSYLVRWFLPDSLPLRCVSACRSLPRGTLNSSPSSVLVGLHAVVSVDTAL